MLKNTKIIKRLTALIFILGLTLALVACGGNSAVPYGSVSEDTTYVSFEGITISERELYDSLRYQAADLLSVMIDEVVFADQLSDVETLINDGDEFFNNFIDETVNEAIFGTSDLDNLQDMADNFPEQLVRMVEQYVDSLYLIDASVNRAELRDAILNLDPQFEGYAGLPTLLEQYLLRAAQRMYAREILFTDVEDDTSDDFVDEQDVVSYYNSNELGRFDVEVFIVRFINLNEANAALYAVGLKSDARGNWYQVPDIRITEGNPGYIDLTDTSAEGYPHVISILEDLNLLDKALEDRNLISTDEFEEYYSDYLISTTRSNGLADVSLPDALVKEKFVEMYNLLNPATQVEINVDGTISGLDSDFSTTYTYDELNDINSTLRSHVYVTLTSENRQDEEDATNPYSARVQTFGTSRYLVYKLSDSGDSEEDIVIDNPQDENEQIFNPDNETAMTLYEELRQEVIDAKLTDAYVTNKVEALYEGVNVQIFDPVIRAFFDQTFAYNGGNDNRDGDDVATVDGEAITVDALFAKLEARYGVSVALDRLMNKYLEASDAYTLTDDELQDFEDQFEDIIQQFSADQFAANGYPASMGREDFLMLAFGVTSNADAVKELYVYPELRQQFLEDYEAHFGEGIYQALTDLAALQYDAYKSTQVSHLLIYFDQDGDGTPDNPAEYLAGVSEEAVTEIKTGLAELVGELYEKLGDFKSNEEAFRTLADLFNSSGRLERGSNTVPYDLQIELEYAKYRQLGFYLKYETISATITNRSNFITNSSTLDPVFYNRAIYLHDLIKGEDGEEMMELPYLDFYDDYTFNGLDFMTELDKVQSDFGWHFIMTTSVSDAPTAVYAAENDEDERYVNDDGLNVYNEGPDDEVNPGTDQLTLNQVEYYVKESLTEEGATLPTAVQTAVNTYLAPIITRYQGTYMQRELIFRLLADGLVFTNPDNTVRFNTTREINLNQLNEYLLSEDGVYDDNYAALYLSWFDILTQE